MPGGTDRSTSAAASSDSASSVVFTPDETQQLVFWEEGGNLLEAWWANSQWHGPIDISAEIGGAWAVSMPQGGDPARHVAAARADLRYHMPSSPPLGSKPSVAIGP